MDFGFLILEFRFQISDVRSRLYSTGRKVSTTQDAPVFALALLSSNKGKYFPDSGCSALTLEDAVPLVQSPSVHQSSFDSSEHVCV